jgi:hypothetical protein
MGAPCAVGASAAGLLTRLGRVPGKVPAVGNNGPQRATTLANGLRDGALTCGLRANLPNGSSWGTPSRDTGVDSRRHGR